MATHLAFFAAAIVGGLKGAHPERFGAAVLILNRLVAANPHVEWRIGDIYIDSAIGDALMLILFGWLALRSDRWWPFAVAGAAALNVLVHTLTVVTDISWDAAVSARVGLWLLIYVALLAGVAERWLAGEAPVSRIGRGRPNQTL